MNIVLWTSFSLMFNASCALIYFLPILFDFNAFTISHFGVATAHQNDAFCVAKKGSWKISPSIKACGSNYYEITIGLLKHLNTIAYIEYLLFGYSNND